MARREFDPNAFRPKNSAPAWPTMGTLRAGPSPSKVLMAWLLAVASAAS